MFPGAAGEEMQGMSRLRELSLLPAAFARSVRDGTTRERKFLQDEILQVRGLMPLLMKPRNKQRWTVEDKAELVIQLRRLSRISPYLVVLVIPGGFFILPVLAWWLDRRRNRARLPGTRT